MSTNRPLDHKSGSRRAPWGTIALCSADVAQTWLKTGSKTACAAQAAGSPPGAHCGPVGPQLCPPTLLFTASQTHQTRALETTLTGPLGMSQVWGCTGRRGPARTGVRNTAQNMVQKQHVGPRPQGRVREPISDLWGLKDAPRRSCSPPDMRFKRELLGPL